MLLIIKNIFLTIYLIACCTLILIISLKFYLLEFFLLDCLMFLNISLIVTKMSKSSLSGSILISLQPSSFSIAFCLFIWSSIYLSLCPFLSVSIASLLNISWSYNLKHYIEFGYVYMSLHNLVQVRSQEFLRAGEVSAN